MSEPKQDQRQRVIRISNNSSELLKKYLIRILDSSKTYGESFRTKMDAIDVAYARYLNAKERNDLMAMKQYGDVPCNIGMSPVVSPIVISQAQSMVAYWSEVFLSGYPIFPVVTIPSLRKEGEALEGIAQDHLVLSESIPEMQLMFNSAAKYNVMAWDLTWSPIRSYNPTKTLTDLDPRQTTIKVDYKHINALKAINLRNIHFDHRVNIAKCDSQGDFLGYTEIYTRARLKEFLNYLSNENKLISNSVVDAALNSTFCPEDYHEDPIISQYDVQDPNANTNWDAYGGFVETLPNTLRQVPSNGQGVYAVHKFYLRILPSDYVMTDVPNKNTVQTWVCYMVNREVIVSMEPFIGPYDRFGAGMSFAIEDGMNLQTQSYAEMAMPLQDAVTKLFNIRFQSAHRALQDRALYNPEMIRAADINAPFMSSKIPVKPSSLLNNNLSNAYYQIPYNAQGTEAVVQDAMIITDWQKELSGQNNATRGQMTKGNRTLGEFDTIMGNSENRMRLSALVIEHRAMIKIKEGIKLNILQFGQDTEIISPRTGEPLQVSVAKLQELNLQFDMADGYTPKSKMANTDFLVAIMQMISSSAPLQQTMGSQLPGMLAHLATLGGLRGFDMYAQAGVEEYAKGMEMQMQIQQLLQQLVAQQQQPQQPQQQAQVPEQ